MPIPVKCPACGAAYTVADDLRGRQMLCKECDQPIVVEEGDSPGPRRKRSPVRIVVGAVFILLALLPAGTLGTLWWTGWLWDQVDWPAIGDEAAAQQKAVTLHLADVDHLNSWKDLFNDLGSLADDGRPHYTSFHMRDDRATVVIAPVSDPEAFVKGIHFGTVQRVRGRVITVTLTGGRRAVRAGAAP